MLNNLYYSTSIIGKEEREAILKQSGHTLWFTGISASGKSTIANLVECNLLRKGYYVSRLDGDNLRHGLCKDLSFSDKDRSENIRRAGEVASLHNEASLIVLCTFISPFESDRDQVRSLHYAQGRAFSEIFIDCSLDVAEKRDPKGLYKKARAGLIKDFTAVDSPYEPPRNPDLVLDSSLISARDCATYITEHILQNQKEKHRSKPVIASIS